MADQRVKGRISRLLDGAGVTVNGPNPWDPQVLDEREYARVFADGTLGLGESYMDGWWDCERLDQLACRVIDAEAQNLLPRNIGTVLLHLRSRWTNRQNRHRSRRVGEKHYDLGNDLLAAMLDSRMTYSCGYWRDARNLEEAQEAKLDLICRKIGLRPGDTVLDIGCGWGSFMAYAAGEKGATCTGVTISREQVSYVAERYQGLSVEAHLKDYRDVEGTYDHVVSIGMFEHVGPKNHRTFFELAHRCLKDGGLFLLQTIGSDESASVIDPWLDRYIFPNGVLPSVAQIGAAVEGLFVVEDWQNFGADYDRTLMSWPDNFERTWPSLRERYGDRFQRMWNYYLLTCAGGFRARRTQLWQVVLSKRGVPGGYRAVR